MEDKFAKRRRISQTESELSNVASSSNTFQNTAVGVAATENATVNVNGNMAINHYNQTKNNLEKLTHIKFQLEDPIPTFTGRDEELKLIKEAFVKSTNKQYNLVVLCGYGGMGKTELAKKYINKNRHEFENIIWINSEYESSMTDNFKRLQNKIKNLGYSCAEFEDIYEYFNNEKCIFVFDNAENMKSIRQFLPKQRNKSLFLVTSHLEEWDLHESIVLDKLVAESAKNFIKSVLHERGVEITEIHLQNLMKKCEFVPLVLQITIGYICEEINMKKRMKKEFNIENIIDNINTKCEIVGKEWPCSSSNSYDKSIYVAVSQSLNKISNKSDDVSKTAVDILGIIAYLDCEFILEKTVKLLLQCNNIDIFEESLGKISQFSLIRFRTIALIKCISLHRTVQECIRWHHRKNKNDFYYSKTLCILLENSFFYFQHPEMILKNGGNYLNALQRFYEENKCRIVYINISNYATIKMLNHLKETTDLTRNVEFLFCALTSERKHIIDLLKESEVNLDITNDEGFNVFYFACDGTWMETEEIWRDIENLIKYGANINSKNLNGNTVLHNWCESGGRDIDHQERDKYVFGSCALLILNGADTEIKNNESETASDIARKQGLHSTYELLTLKDKNNVFNLIAKCLQFDLLQRLIRNRICDVNKQDSEGNTILHTLCSLEENDFTTEYGIFNTITYSIIFQKGNYFIKNNNGETAFCISLRKNHKCFAEVLFIYFPFELLSFCWHNGMIEKFPYTYTRNIDDINYQDENGNTFLHVVCGLETSNSVSEQDLLKYIIFLIIKNQPETNIKNAAGETVADVARRRNRMLLVDYFQMKTQTAPDLIELALKYGNIGLVEFIKSRSGVGNLRPAPTFCVTRHKSHSHLYHQLYSKEAKHLLSVRSSRIIT